MTSEEHVRILREIALGENHPLISYEADQIREAADRLEHLDAMNAVMREQRDELEAENAKLRELVLCQYCGQRLKYLPRHVHPACEQCFEELRHGAPR